METKQIKIYLGTDKKPYSDEERTKLFPQVSDQTFVGENNVSLVEFDLSLLSSFATAIAVIKKPDGEISYQILTPKEIEGKEFYELSLTNYYTNQKGALIIAVELYEAGVVITTIGDLQYIELNGNERILKSESIKLYINYAPFLLPTNEELTSSDLQNILFAISSRVPKTTKINGKELSQDISLVASDIPLDDKNVEIAIDELKDEDISLLGEITKILNGSTVVKKAQQDDEGQPIKTTYVKHSQVVNSLLESTTDNPLSALQGKLLNEKILTIQDILESVDTDLDTIQDWVNTQLTTKQSTSEKGQPSGYASLDSGGKVPTAQLPSYVDDVLEYANLSNFPATGMSGIIYVALDTNLTYRWGGSAYIEISPSLALGETDATAYRGDRGKIAYDHSQMTSGNPHNTTKAMIDLGNVDNTSDLNKPISIATQNALNKKADKLVLTNLVSNGDLLIPKASPNENQALGFNYVDATDISLTNGIAKFTATARTGRLDQLIGSIAMNDKYYAFARFKAQNNLVAFRTTDVYVGGLYLSHIGDNNMHFYSGVYTQTIDSNLYIRVADGNNSPNFTPIEVDYIGAINLTTTFGAGNEPTKEQMDAIIKLKGYFDTTTIDLKDLMLLGFPQEMVDYVKENKTLIDELTENTVALVNITWSNLKALRDGAQLVPGRQYRITDYATTTAQQDTQSAGHTFDLIVVADSVNKLNEQARAIQHAEDTYFANSKLEAWQVWYSLDNDTTRFAWADTVNGKGVIYRMIDEFNNDCPYDFKNIQFIRKITDGELDLEDGVDTWVYTFTAYDTNLQLIQDATTSVYRKTTPPPGIGNDTYRDGCENNSIGVYDWSDDNWTDVLHLSNNVFLNTHYYVDDTDCMFVSCMFNKLGSANSDNTFGNYVSNNTFGNDVSNNSFGNDVDSNTFGNGVSNNSFGNDVYSNSFGNGVSNNTFGNYVSNNSFGNDVYNNSFGNDVSNNTFGNGVYSNTFGNGCNSNTFGNNCYYLKISENAGSKKYLNIDNGLQGASSVNQLELYDSAIADKSYRISFKKASSGRYLMLWATDTGAMTGKYKALNTDLTWTDL